jgi:hypothetical protein
MTGGQIEVTSSGTYDVEELGWVAPLSTLTANYQTFTFLLSSAAVTGGAFNPTAIDYIRVYVTTSGGTNSISWKNANILYPGEPAGRDRFEDYIDATDCTTTDQLTQRGNETLTLKAGTESLEFIFNTENQSEVYGVDFKCGDIVTVIDPDVATLVDRITSVTTTYDQNGKTIKLGMGTSAPDLVSILKMDRKQNTGVRR